MRREALVLLSVTALSACGGAHKNPPASHRVAPANANADLLIPEHVPRIARGSADPAAVRVIARWLGALRGGHEARAARYWATGAKFQNDSPVLTIDTPLEKLAIQRSLPCGAKIRSAGGAKGFVVLLFVLTERPGGLCRTGAGHTARGAIRVAGGKIVEWYRLPDDPAQYQPPWAVTAGGSSA